MFDSSYNNKKSCFVWPRLGKGCKLMNVHVQFIRVLELVQYNVNDNGHPAYAGGVL